MNTKQKLTFLAALVLASGAAYAMIAANTKIAANTEMAANTREASASATQEEIAKAEAMSVERLQKIIEYRGNTPIVADYCRATPKWAWSGHEEVDCGLTGFRGYLEIYSAGWKVTTVVPGEFGVELVFIERIGTEQWKGQHVSFN